MNTLSNIIPNPLSINKILNSNYSTTRFATSDYDGKNNTDVISKYKDNIIPAKIQNLSTKNSSSYFYLGGIGEIGLLMENVNFINNIINSYKGNLISLDGKYASSTFYSEDNVFNKNYTIGKDIEDIWYYDVSYGMIAHDKISNPYQCIPMYKYNIKDFDSTEDDYDEVDGSNLYLGETNEDRFNPLDFAYYVQDDIFDNLENTMSYTFFYDRSDSYETKYSITNFSNVLIYEEKTTLSDPNDMFGDTILYHEIKLADGVNGIYVKNIVNNQFIECTLLNNETDRFYYIYYTSNGGNYIIYTNNPEVNIYKANNLLVGSNIMVFSNIPIGSIDCKSTGNVINEVYIYYKYQKETQEQINNRILGLLELNSRNIMKYPIYYQTPYSYSFPLLPSNKLDNYYDCEFYFIIPAFNKKETNDNNTNYTISTIYNNIKLSLKFGDGEIKEILEPYVRLYDGIVYKFRKSYLFDYMFIPNQELVISLIDYSQSELKDRVLWSKKLHFNLFRLIIQQGKYQDIDLKMRYTNYYPLKYPLSSRKKFIELDYIPIDNISNVSESILIDANSKFNSDNISFNDNILVSINNLSNNYSYLKTDIYHNLSDGPDILPWFLMNNSNGLRIGTSEKASDNTYSMFTFSLSNNVLSNYNVETLNIYYKNFVYYDKNGIIDGSSTDVKLAEQKYDNVTKQNNFSIPIYGMKQVIYIPYNFNIDNVYGSRRMNFNGGFNGYGEKLYSIFEDYIIIYNNTGETNPVNLYFYDESLTLCEGTRSISITNGEILVYKPSKHKNYSIVIKNVLLNKYKLKLHKIYENELNSGSSRIENIISHLDLILLSDSSSRFNDYIASAKQQDNQEIISIPIYNYTIPLLGNVVIIEKL